MRTAIILVDDTVVSGETALPFVDALAKYKKLTTGTGFKKLWTNDGGELYRHRLTPATTDKTSKKAK